MLFYQHRTSKDIDIFINDVQYITYLSPRLNDSFGNDLKGYEEDANVVKIRYAEGEIDFIAAPRLIPNSTSAVNILGRSVVIDHPSEIIAKKCFYRGNYFTVRDMYDFIVFSHNDQQDILDNYDIFYAKREGIVERIAQYQKNERLYLHELHNIHPMPGYEQLRERVLAEAESCFTNPKRYLEECSRFASLATNNPVNIKDAITQLEHIIEKCENHRKIEGLDKKQRPRNGRLNP